MRQRIRESRRDSVELFFSRRLRKTPNRFDRVDQPGLWDAYHEEFPDEYGRTEFFKLLRPYMGGKAKERVRRPDSSLWAHVWEGWKLLPAATSKPHPTVILQASDLGCA